MGMHKMLELKQNGIWFDVTLVDGTNVTNDVTQRSRGR